MTTRSKHTTVDAADVRALAAHLRQQAGPRITRKMDRQIWDGRQRGRAEAFRAAARALDQLVRTTWTVRT